MNKSIIWLVVGGVLLVTGAAGIVAQFLPSEAGIAALLIGLTAIFYGLQQKGVVIPKIPTWVSVVAWAVIAVGLFIVFSLMGSHA